MLAKILIALDTFIIERLLEPLTWRIELRWGKTNYWCSRAALLAFGGAMLLVFGLFGYDLLNILLMLGALFWGSQMYLISERDEWLSRPGFMNSERLYWQTRITLSLAFVATFCYQFDVSTVRAIWYDSLIFIQSSGFVLAMYFAACSRPPPKWKQEQETKAAERQLVKQSI